MIPRLGTMWSTLPASFQRGSYTGGQAKSLNAHVQAVRVFMLKKYISFLNSHPVSIDIE